MKFKRVFCFGCSYTEYIWPTWANILQKDLDIPVYNWGLCGLGNIGIHSRMVQCDIMNKFTSDDLIIVVWSSWTREDRWIDGFWKHHGNLFNQSFYDQKFIDKYWDWENDIIKNSTAIISANKMFDIAVNFSMVPMDNPKDVYIPDHVNLRTFEQGKQQELLNFYYQSMPKFGNFQDIPNSKYNKSTTDSHPDINCHRDFLIQNLYPILGVSIKDSTLNDIQGFYSACQIQLAKLNTNNWEEMKNCVKNLWSNGKWDRNRIENIDI